MNISFKFVFEMKSFKFEKIDFEMIYSVEWSVDSTFQPIEGSLLVKDLRRLNVTLPNLVTGETYFVRVTAGNLKGFGPPCLASPPSATPSCKKMNLQFLFKFQKYFNLELKFFSAWFDGSAGEARNPTKQLMELNQLYHEIRDFRMSNPLDRNSLFSESPQKKKKQSLRNLFLSTSKFYRTLRKGVYLASILYHEDKIVCTVDDCIPIVEVDETHPGSNITAEFHWFMKVSCAWDDMKLLILDTECLRNSPSLHFRMKLLDAAVNMQLALGVQDLGRLHYQPITDEHGVTIFVTVQHVADLKTVQVKISPFFC